MLDFLLFRSYEKHQQKLRQIKQEIEKKKAGQLKIIDEKDELLKMRVMSNKLRSHEF